MDDQQVFRAEEDKRLAMMKKEEEDRLRREIEEKKQREMEEKRRRLAEVEQKRQAADKASKVMIAHTTIATDRICNRPFTNLTVIY